MRKVIEYEEKKYSLMNIHIQMVARSLKEKFLWPLPRGSPCFVVCANLDSVVTNQRSPATARKTHSQAMLYLAQQVSGKLDAIRSGNNHIALSTYRSDLPHRLLTFPRTLSCSVLAPTK